MTHKSDSPFADSLAASRRKFLKTGCVGVGAAVLAGCATTFPGEFGTVKVIASGDAIAFDTTAPSFTALATVGGMVAVDAGSLQLVLIRSATDTVLAFSRLCPHAMADMGPDAEGTYDVSTGLLTCNLHGSTFDNTGTCTHGLAKSKPPLKKYVVTFDGTKGSVALV